MSTAAKPKTFTVRGSGSFPLDMLRYDRCWPSDFTAVYHLSNSDICEDDGTREVLLAGLGCTPARWESFGWEVKTR